MVSFLTSCGILNIFLCVLMGLFGFLGRSERNQVQKQRKRERERERYERHQYWSFFLNINQIFLNPFQIQF